MATEYFRQSFSTILNSLIPIHKSKENKVYKLSDESVDTIQMQTFSDDDVDDEEVINTKTESVHQRKSLNPSSGQTITPADINKAIETLDEAKEQLQQREYSQRKLIVTVGLAIFSALAVAAFFVAPPVTIVAFFVTAALVISVVALHEKYYAQEISDLEDKSKNPESLQPLERHKAASQLENTREQNHLITTVSPNQNFSSVGSAPPFIPKPIEHADYKNKNLFFPRIASKAHALALDFIEGAGNIASLLRYDVYK